MQKIFVLICYAFVLLCNTSCEEYMDIQKYAFRKYKIKSIEGSHTHLAPEELHKFENLQLTGRYTRLQKTKDAFLRVMQLSFITHN